PRLRGPGRRATRGVAPRRPCAPAARRRRISSRVSAPRSVVRVRRLAAAVPDHSLDLESHGERSHILGLGQHDLLTGARPPDGADQMENLELERVVLVNLYVLDERRTSVADRLPVERVFLRGAPVDPD